MSVKRGAGDSSESDDNKPLKKRKEVMSPNTVRTLTKVISQRWGRKQVKRATHRESSANRPWSNRSWSNGSCSYRSCSNRSWFNRSWSNGSCSYRSCSYRSCSNRSRLCMYPLSHAHAHAHAHAVCRFEKRPNSNIYCAIFTITARTAKADTAITRHDGI